MEQEQNTIFNDRTTAQIDAKLQRDILAHEDKMFKITAIVIIILIFIFRGWIGYWLKFGFAIPSGIDPKPISVEDDPIQINYTEEESRHKVFIYKSLINDNKIKMIPQASYKLSGLVVAHNHQFLFTKGFFDSAALYDLGASWGKMGDKTFYTKYFKSYSEKNEVTGSRVLWTQQVRPAPVDRNYTDSHFSHSHIVPANKNVMAALLTLKTWDKVEIEGELVDMEYSKNGWTHRYQTSMSRTDEGWGGDRGNGSCETIYVTKVKIKNKIYK